MTTTETDLSTGITLVDSVKWVATIIQLIGDGFVGLNVLLWNVFAALVGIYFVVCGSRDVEGQGDHGGPSWRLCVAVGGKSEFLKLLGKRGRT